MGKMKGDIATLRNSSANDIEYGDLRKAVLVLRAIYHDTRQQMIKLLMDSGRLTVTDLYIKLRQEQSVVSQHLAILRRAGVVNTEREGKFIYYSINPDRLEQISRLVDELAS